MPARGVLYVHSCPAAVCAHVEWAISRVLGAPVRLEWTAQPADPSTQRAECQWTGRPGTGGDLATALRQWQMLRFELTEDPGPGVDGERIAYLPSLGVFRSPMSASGDVLVGEDRLRALLSSSRNSDALAHGMEKLLGTAWDAELEPYRYAGDGAPVTFLTQVS